MDPIRVASLFDVVGTFTSLEPLGEGNVNDTYLVTYSESGDKYPFVLQRLNRTVFPSPENVMHNFRKVTDHVRRHLQRSPEAMDRIRDLPAVIPTKQGDDYLIDGDGECWRAMTLITDAVTHESVQTLRHAREVGHVLGQFHDLLRDISPGSLRDALPGFHITPRYLTQLDETLTSDAARTRLDRSPDGQSLLTFVEERRAMAAVLEDASARGELQRRPVHGDPKVANIMVDVSTAHGISIIDLDTVKPGLIHYDVGDCLRSGCNPAGEDPESIDEVTFDLGVCEAILEGYMTSARGFLTDSDRRYLFDAVRTMTFELAMRFFTDHLAGDTYFKIRYPGQNLKRARVQQRLCLSIEQQEADIRAIVERSG